MKTIIIYNHMYYRPIMVGDFTITFKPFSISLPSWYKPVGIICLCWQWRYITLENTLKGISMVSMMG